MNESVEITTDINVVEVTNVSNVVDISTPGPQGPTPDLTTASVRYASYTGQTDFNALTISGSPVATQTYTNSQIAVHNADTTNVHGITDTSVPERLRWNDADGTLEFVLKGGNVTLQIGQESVIIVVNKTGADLLESEYKAVRLSSAQGQRPAVILARADLDANSVDTVGLATETIIKNQEGYVTTSGIVNKINTTGALQGETWVDGDVLYLSPYTYGAITNVKPQAPSHTVVIGYVIYAHQTQGKIFVKVDNGYEIDELHNVRITGAANNDLLRYNSTSAVWQNFPMSTASVAHSTTTSQTNFSALTVSGSSVATQAFVLANTPDVAGSAYYAFNSGSLAGQPGSYYALIDSPNLTGTPLAPTAASGTNTTQIATTQFVRTEVAGIVDSAPSTLDTLNELAAALGDDPNFAATTASLIGTKAPINNPTFTGVVTMPTASVTGQMSASTINIQSSASVGGGITSITSGTNVPLIASIPSSGLDKDFIRFLANTGNYGSIIAATTNDTIKFQANGNASNLTIEATGAVVGNIYITPKSTRSVLINQGNVGIGASAPTAQLHVISPNAASVGLIVQAASAQSANLQEWLTSGGSIIGSFNSNGSFLVQNISGVANTGAYTSHTGAGLSIIGRSDVVQFIVKGQTSQTSDLQQWQNSSGSVVAEIDARGGATFTSASVGGQSLTPAQAAANIYLAYYFV